MSYLDIPSGRGCTPVEAHMGRGMLFPRPAPTPRE
jgi:hypothetical protein